MEHAEQLTVAVGVGLVVSLLFSELFGLAAGGMVVPGYVAMHLNSPWNVGLTLAAGVVTYLVVHLLSLLVIVYGKRRTVLMILIGYLIGIAIHSLLLRGPTWLSSEVSVIGFIIPGLIAIWIDRQGWVETLSTLLTASVVVRLVLILVFGKDLNA